MDDVIGYVVFAGGKAKAVTLTMPYTITGLEGGETEYKDIYVIAIDNKGNAKKSKNTLTERTLDVKYVADGLTNCYDGRLSATNAAATVWNDLVGNKDLELKNFNNNSSSGWTTNGLMFDGNSDGIYLGNKYQDFFKTSGTIEIAVKFNNTNRRGCLIGNYSNSNNINIEQYYTNTRFYWNDGSPDVTSSKGELSSGDYMTITYEFDRTNKKIYGYKNAENIFTFSNNAFGTYNFNWVNAWIGRESSRSEMSIMGTIYKIRFYNRVLTAEEITKNHQVDVNTFE